VRAFVGGYQSDRVAYAFASGYQEALRRLMPKHPPGDKMVLCASEEQGAHPSKIQTKLESREGRYYLSGKKTWSTLGTEADTMLVVASTGLGEDGRNRLTVVVVPTNRAGVTITRMPETAFVPEIPHATVTFDSVRVDEDEWLDGDGYLEYLKPFRTIEDIHVHSALLGHLLRIARSHDFPNHLASEMLAIAVTLRALVDQPPLDPAVHVTLAGAISQTAQLIESLEPHWQNVEEPVRSRWQRDRALLQVADKAREKRFESAWQRLTSS
jgi:hypothetical protein